MEYCVYKHTSPSGKVYIGITSTNPKRRWESGRGYMHNIYFSRAIEKYGWDGFSHEILFTGLSAEEAEEAERKLIAEYHAADRDYGYNITDGGEKGKRHAPESIEKLRQAKEGKYSGENNPRYGCVVSAETRSKISASLKGKMSGEKNPNYGKPMSDEQKKIIGERRRGKHYPNLSESMKKSLKIKALSEKRMIPVFQYTKGGEFVRAWRSAPEAALVLCGRRGGQANICSCANGKLKSAYGYLWSYVADGVSRGSQ